MTKTWVDLLGLYTEDCQVQGCYIVRKTGANTFKVLFTFEHKTYAQQAIKIWKFQSENGGQNVSS